MTLCLPRKANIRKLICNKKTKELNRSNRSDEGLTLETSAFYPLRWLIYVFNSVVITKLPAKELHLDMIKRPILGWLFYG